MNPKKEKFIQFARADPNYTSGLPRLIFEGESMISGKTYSYLLSYTPHPNDRVMAAKGVVVRKIVRGERHQSKCTVTKCLFYSSNKLGEDHYAESLICFLRYVFIFNSLLN